MPPLSEATDISAYLILNPSAGSAPALTESLTRAARRVACRRTLLEPFCTYDQTLLEGGDRGASLQRQHIPPSHLPRNP